MNKESRFTNFLKWNPTMVYLMFLARHIHDDQARFVNSLSQKDFDDMDKAGISPSVLIDYTNPRGAVPADEGIIVSLWDYFGKRSILFTTGNFLTEKASNEILDLIENIKVAEQKIAEQCEDATEAAGWAQDEYRALVDELEVRYDKYIEESRRDGLNSLFDIGDEIREDFSLEKFTKNL